MYYRGNVSKSCLKFLFFIEKLLKEIKFKKVVKSKKKLIDDFEDDKSKKVIKKRFVKNFLDSDFLEDDFFFKKVVGVKKVGENRIFFDFFVFFRDERNNLF